MIRDATDLQGLVDYLRGEEMYQNIRIMDDGAIVGTRDLMFTRALYIDMDRHGWGRRYCYEDRELADIASRALRDAEDEPLPGWVARRGA